ncbi:glycosyltransferase family 2 protein [Hungatella effluvii]|uniref:glycosyltransferase family 2 protein n=1 Tax=Hungatella effluvii TaxID=1096246 RepID=UPI0022E8BE96|nr:glycosyltransferase family 2 protein [Hungatella effluvii]
MSNLWSIIVLTYQSELSEIRRTLYSILSQTCKEIEIIISDDGSNDNHFEEIEAYLKECHCKSYILLPHSENVGTVRNLFDALMCAKGRFVKAIGAGDMLYSTDTLDKVYTFMSKSNCYIAFGLLKAFYFRNDEIFYPDFFVPQDLSAFKKNRKRQIQRNIIVYSRCISGASFFLERNVLVRLLSKIVGRVKYCEDWFQVLALLENIEIHYLDDYVIWYEYGTGISTSVNSASNERMQCDYESFMNYICEDYRTNPYVQRKKRILKLNQRVPNKYFRLFFKCLVEPAMFIVPIKTKIQGRAGAYYKNTKGFLYKANSTFLKGES